MFFRLIFCCDGVFKVVLVSSKSLEISPTNGATNDMEFVRYSNAGGEGNLRR